MQRLRICLAQFASISWLLRMWNSEIAVSAEHIFMATVEKSMWHAQMWVNRIYVQAVLSSPGVSSCTVCSTKKRKNTKGGAASMPIPMLRWFSKITKRWFVERILEGSPHFSFTNLQWRSELHNIAKTTRMMMKRQWFKETKMLCHSGRWNLIKDISKKKSEP